MPFDTVALAIVIAVVFVLVSVLYLSVRVVNQYERWSSSGWARRARVDGQRPGPDFLIPFIDRPVKVDIREQFIEVPSQTTSPRTTRRSTSTS